MILLQGKEVSQKIRDQLQVRVKKFKDQTGRGPRLDVIIVGDDKASHIYVKNKHVACEKIGMQSHVHQLSGMTSEDEVLGLIKRLNSDKNVDGILVQMPVPKHISSQKVLDTISPDKDADGLTPTSAGRLWSGKPGVKPCTPHGVMHILEHYNISVSGKKAVVVGRSQIVGKPMAALLLEKDATVFVCHSKTENLEEITKQGDIVVVAAGKPRFLGKSAFKKDAVVVDVGIHGSGTGQICGDVRSDELENWVKAVTPVPGGVGPMTITCLLENTLWLAERGLK
jgi:methylenetetrahydrofolate dehydrogenase (NADP+) / methenyltetrahydrofolate cyclohydrolase